MQIVLTRAETGIAKEMQIKKWVLAWDHLHLTSAQLGQVDNKELLSSHLLVGISWIFLTHPTITWIAWTYDYGDKVDPWWYPWFLRDLVALKGHLSLTK